MAVIHIVEEKTGQVEIWVDVPGAELDGVIVGVGESRAMAMADAVRTLEALTAQLQSPPDVWETDPTDYTLRGHKREFTIASHRFAGDI
jgi:hypothetical protein